jgi:hypothetical protein
MSAYLIAIAVNEDGCLSAAEGMKEDKASWVNFSRITSFRQNLQIKFAHTGKLFKNP